MGLQSRDRLTGSLEAARTAGGRTVNVNVEEEIGIVGGCFGDIDKLRGVAIVDVFGFHPGVAESGVADRLERLDIDADLFEPVSEFLIVSGHSERCEGGDEEEDEE